MREVNYLENQQIFREKTGLEFNNFYNKYYDRIYKYVSKVINTTNISSSTIDDITSETFITTIDKIDLFNNEKSKIQTWVYTIAKNLTVQEIRNNKKSSVIDFDGYSSLDDIDIPDITDEILLEQFKNQEIYNILSNNISLLKEPYRTILEMRELKGMKYREIASTYDDVCFEVEIKNENDYVEFDTKIKDIVIYDIDTEDKVDFEYFDINNNINIHLPIGKFRIFCKEMRNISNIKSQIRMGRKLLLEVSKEEIQRLDM